MAGDSSGKGRDVVVAVHDWRDRYESSSLRRQMVQLLLIGQDDPENLHLMRGIADGFATLHGREYAMLEDRAGLHFVPVEQVIDVLPPW